MAQRRYEAVGHPCNTEHWEQLRICLTMEYVFGSIKSHALKARDSAKLCLGEQSLSSKLRRSATEHQPGADFAWASGHQPGSCML